MKLYIPLLFTLKVSCTGFQNDIRKGGWADACLTFPTPLARLIRGGSLWKQARLGWPPRGSRWELEVTEVDVAAA